MCAFVTLFAAQMKTACILLAAMVASASAFAPAAVGMPKSLSLRSSKPAVTALKAEFEIVDGTPFKLSTAPVGAFGFAGWVSTLRKALCAGRLLTCPIVCGSSAC